MLLLIFIKMTHFFEKNSTNKQVKQSKSIARPVTSLYQRGNYQTASKNESTAA